MDGPSKTKYAWESMLDGEWHLVRTFESGAGRLGAPVRTAAYTWAARHGYTARTRSTFGGRELYVKFVKDGS